MNKTVKKFKAKKMTIVIAIKINEGIVMASDSATAVFPEGKLDNIYYNRKKLFNLIKGLPIGIVTFGDGEIGDLTIPLLVRKFRRIINDKDGEIQLNTRNLVMRNVALKFLKFLKIELHNAKEEGNLQSHQIIGFLIGGYSTKADVPELWEVKIENFRDFIIEQQGYSWRGQGEIIQRILYGHCTKLGSILKNHNLTDEIIKSILNECKQDLRAKMIINTMPIKDVIEVAMFLMQTTIKYYRYRSGFSLVGGSIDIASITREKGFRWIQRQNSHIC